MNKRSRSIDGSVAIQCVHASRREYSTLLKGKR